MTIKIKGATPKGSVVFVDGVFYTRGWETVYIPLDAEEAKQFVEMLTEFETLEKRQLRPEEVMEYASDFDPDTWRFDYLE